MSSEEDNREAKISGKNEDIFVQLRQDFLERGNWSISTSPEPTVVNWLQHSQTTIPASFFAPEPLYVIFVDFDLCDVD